ncbi:enoyl-CoA hydratase/isomerase family protein [Pseudonocardiaceae bacterium YIM PH 21723]|nr:enoyl-CoA hydratase/isomerase family protein [Pseudonocardiaceae bacterium YIM PH 21723]
MPSLRQDGAVHILDFGDDENRFHPDWLKVVHAHLDEVEASAEPTALVTTASGKFFSNGLDLDWVQANGDKFIDYIGEVHAFLSRVLTLPVPTVAAINGHAFGGGALISLSHDFRVMRGDRGFWCLPEADINIPFSKGMSALVQGKLTPSAAVLAMTTGRRFGGEDAQRYDIVDATAPQDEVLATALEIARPLVGKLPATLSTIKNTMYAPIVEALQTV